MSKSRLVSGRIKKVTGAELNTDRYEYLDLANAEPDLGLPSVDESILVGNVDGSRTWADIASYAEEFKGYTGSQGETGFAGSQGDVGFVGSQGPQGNFGGVTFDYTFDSATSDADPGTGKLRLNNAAIASAMQLYIHDTDDANANLDAYLTTIDASTSQLKGHVRISNKANSNDFAIFSITDVSTNNGTYFTVPVAFVSGTAVSFDNLEDIIVTFARTGDKGDIGYAGSQGDVGFTGSAGADGFVGVDGAQGETGFTGSQGETGFTGSQGVTGFTGSRGTDGIVGSDGAAGENGFTGSQGDIGYTGSQGEEGESSFVFSDTPPSNPAVGDRWYDTTLGFEFVWVDDGDTAQWVEITTAGNGERGFTGSQGYGSVNFLTRNYTGNSTTTVYTVSAGLSVDNVFVFENGVMQFPITDYTITGTNLTFITAPATGVAIQIRELNNAGSASSAGGGGATGGGGDQVFYENDQIVTTSYAITSGKSALTAGPITIADGAVVTIPTGSRWVIL